MRNSASDITGQSPSPHMLPRIGTPYLSGLQTAPLPCARTDECVRRYVFLPLEIASRASLSEVRRRSVSRLSHSCLPLARASSTLIFPLLKYIRVGIRVNPFWFVLPISLRISSL